jgi:hypothetical protein
VISASALVPHCRHDKAVLSKKRKVTPEKAQAQQEAIDGGLAFHKAIEDWILSGKYPLVDDLELQGWIDTLAAQWTPSVDAEAEIAWGLRPDGGYTDVDEPEPHVYVPHGGGQLLTAGRADVAFERRGVLYVIDWKAGKWPAADRLLDARTMFQDALDNLQVNAAGIALAQRAGATSYVPAIYYVRDGVFDEGDEVPLDSTAHAAMLDQVRAAATLDDEPHPGSWCSRCWSRKQCKEAQP